MHTQMNNQTIQIVDVCVNNNCMFLMCARDDDKALFINVYCLDDFDKNQVLGNCLESIGVGNKRQGLTYSITASDKYLILSNNNDQLDIFELM